MTTTTDKLLARADEYERKAQMLRFAAAELNGEATNGKRKTLVSTLDAAIALRKGQREATNGHHATRPHVTMVERGATVREFLEACSGPQTTRAIQGRLEAAGQECSTSWTLRVLNAMKDVHKVGKGNQSTWGLGKSPKAVTKRDSTKAAIQATRERVANVLNHYDRETAKAPGDVARELGLTVAQSGLAPLVHQGYLKKRKGGYIRTAKPYVVVAPNSAQP